METKFSVNITKKEHFQFLMHDLLFQLVILSIAAWLAVTGYAAITLASRFGSLTPLALKNLAVNAALILAGVLAFDALFLLLCRESARRRAENEKGYSPVEVTLNDLGVRFLTENSDLTVKWDGVSSVRETKKLFVFEFGSRGSVKLPKSQMDESALISLRAHVVSAADKAPEEEKSEE